MAAVCRHPAAEPQPCAVHRRRRRRLGGQGLPDRPARTTARAYGLTRSREGKIDLLFKLVEVYRETDQWDKVLGCWDAVVTTDPQNVKARLGQLKYCYILADSLGQRGAEHERATGRRSCPRRERRWRWSRRPAW